MADLYGFVQQQNVGRAAEGTSRGVRLTRDGAIVQVPWLQALCLEGRVFVTHFGATDMATTEATFAAGDIDGTEIDMLATIPATVACLPVYAKCAFDAIGTIDEVDFMVGWGSGGVIGANSVAVVPRNLRPASGVAPLITVATQGDAAGTAVTLTGVIFHEATFGLTGVAATPAQLGYEWSAMSSGGVVPVIEGARQLVGLTGSQAGTGYQTYVWVELPISAVV